MAARTVQECNDYIVTNLVNTFASVGITITPTLWSQTNLIRLICYSIAIAQSLFEQLQDIYIAQMQAIQDVSAPASVRWMQDACFKFQYSATTPQYLVVTSGIAEYPIINEALRIVTACAVQSTVSNIVNIKVAKGTTLGALSAPELAALDAYVIQKGGGGITYNVTSIDPDKLYIEATIYYNGLYSAVISTNVIAAINTYLYNLSKDKDRFGGDILMSDLELLVKGVEGVNDVVFERVSVRADATTIFNGIDLTLAGDVINRKATLTAGYAVEETTAGSTFANKLTFTAE